MRTVFFTLMICSMAWGQDDTRIDYDHFVKTLQFLRQKTGREWRVSEDLVIENIRHHGLGFVVSDAVIDEMRRANASDTLIQVARESGLKPGGMLDQAEAELAAGRCQQAASMAEVAVKLQPAPGAWDLIGRAREKCRDAAGAREAYREVLNAGGEITIPVSLAPPGENFRKACDGTLKISRSRLAIRSATDCRIALDTTDGEIVEVARNEFVGADRRAFHITVQLSRGEVENFSLAPADRSAETRDWIMGALHYFRKP